MPFYKDIAIEEVHVASFNPSRRVAKSTLTGLILSIREHGMMTPVSLTRQMVLADGHRRLAAAKILKLECIPAAIYAESTLTAPELWVLLNGETMNLSPSQWLSAVHAGLPLDTPGFPDRLRARITRLYELCPRRDVDQLVEEGRSPMILDAAERTLKYLGRPTSDVAFLTKTLTWLIHTGNAWAIKGAMHEEIPADLLEDAIKTGHQIGRVWDMVR